MCWADILKPMGMPPVSVRTSSARARKSPAVTRSGNRDGLIAGVPGSRSRTWAILPVTLVPGRCPPRARLRPLSPLEVEGLREARLLHRPPEPGGRQLVEVARVALLFLGQHAAFARADAGAGHLGPPGERELGLLAQGAEAHVAHEDGDFEEERPLRPGTDDQLRAHGVVVREGTGGELARENLDVRPAREFGERHPHRRDHPVVADLLQTVPREFLDVVVVGLLGGPCKSA